MTKIILLRNCIRLVCKISLIMRGYLRLANLPLFPKFLFVFDIFFSINLCTNSRSMSCILIYFYLFEAPLFAIPRNKTKHTAIWCQRCASQHVTLLATRQFIHPRRGQITCQRAVHLSDSASAHEDACVTVTYRVRPRSKGDSQSLPRLVSSH